LLYVPPDGLRGSRSRLEAATMREAQMGVKITGMDRLAAMELQELFDAEGLADQIEITESEIKTGKAGALDALAAVLTDHSSSAMLLLLTSWIVSKKNISIAIVKRDPKTGEERSYKIQYKQEGPVSVLKQLKSIFSDR
jgi:hypothetical protein